MPLSERDPHYALGIEHGRAGIPAYGDWQDAEHLRRYMAGYAFAVGARVGSAIADEESLRRFQRLGSQMQVIRNWNTWSGRS